jgi:putative transposase
MTHHGCANTILGDVTDGAARRAVFAGFVRSGLQEVIDAELTAALGADRYERTDTRTNYRNGTWPKTVATVSGDVEAAIPRLQIVMLETETGTIELAVSRQDVQQLVSKVVQTAQ